MNFYCKIEMLALVTTWTVALKGRGVKAAISSLLALKGKGLKAAISSLASATSRVVLMYS